MYIDVPDFLVESTHLPNLIEFETQKCDQYSFTFSHVLIFVSLILFSRALSGKAERFHCSYNFALSLVVFD